MTTATAEQIRALCEQYAKEKYPKQLSGWEKEHEEIWYLPILNEDSTQVEKLGIFKMVDRHIMSQAQDKLAQGFYVYIEYMMKECLLNNDDDGNYIIENERAFLGAAPQFNKMVEGINVAFVKR